MKWLRQRLEAQPVDAGISLVEVIVALVVFSIATTGLAAGAMSISRITNDSAARQVATNLAARELDRVRAIGDPLSVQAETTSTSVTDPGLDADRTYTITRTVSSVTGSGSDSTCGTVATFAYRRVSVQVTWTGRLGSTTPVRSDTVLAPTTPVADAGTGAISVKVIGSDGTPRPDVTVTISPVVDGRALSAQPDPTDVEGCSYANRVVPGTYRIQVSKAGFVDRDQQATPSTDTAVVAAGSTYGFQVQFDRASTFTTAYAKNYAGTPVLPTNLETSFVAVSSSANIVTRSPAATSQDLHPGTYEAVAGTFADASRTPRCLMIDPAAWPAGSVGVKSMKPGVRAAASAAVGGTGAFATSTTASIPMGVVKATAPIGSVLTARAAAPAGLGNPGCATPPTTTYSFGAVGSSGVAYLALPFGSWTIYRGGTTQLAVTDVLVMTNANANGVTGTGSSNVVTLDPRAANP